MNKFLIVLVILLAGGVIFLFLDNKTTPETINPPVTTPTPTPTPPTPTTQTYSNATYGFNIEYPLYMKFVTPNYANLQDKIVAIQIPREEYPKTNFGDAAISVSAQAASSLADCLKLAPPEGSDGFKTKVVINGVDFYMTKSSGVGAGNLYESNVYRTVKAPNGACIEIAATIHTSNIGNYPAGTVTEVNKPQITAKLDTVVNSFKFNQ